MVEARPPIRSSTPDEKLLLFYSTVLLVHLARGRRRVLLLGPLGAAFVGLGRFARRLRAIHFVSRWHVAPPRLQVAVQT